MKHVCANVACACACAWIGYAVASGSIWWRFCGARVGRNLHVKSELKAYSKTPNTTPSEIQCAKNQTRINTSVFFPSVFFFPSNFNLFFQRISYKFTTPPANILVCVSLSPHKIKKRRERKQKLQDTKEEAFSPFLSKLSPGSKITILHKERREI